MTGRVTVSLRIENTYADGETVTTTVDTTVSPPTWDELDEWAWEEIFPHTGTGKTDGDSWYDVKITASSEPRLVGRKFEYGY